jgi:U4/U6.U5 tri-snRNP-associated protein 1
MADIDYEQQNRIRIALGLKPLPVPGASATTPGPTFKDHSSSSDDSEKEDPASTLETRQAASYENWKKIQDEAEAKKRRAAKAEAIKKARDAAQKYVKLEGKGLGDVDPDVDKDTRSWLLGANKRQKRLERERARRMEEELVERERLAAVEYGATDLAGVKVGHEIGDFEDGEGEQILTLKDTTIDENEEEGDELENAEIKARDQLKERLELKKRKPVYDPHAADENGEKKVLAQYDEEIDGKKRKHFVFDGQGTTVEEQQAKRQELGERLKSQPISLDFFKDEPKSDYMEMSEVKMKKPKRSKKKATRQRAVDENDDIFPLQTNGDVSNHDSMDVDGAASPARKNRKEVGKDLVDDEDLQASLAAQRRLAFKKRKRQRPEDIAREIQEEGSATPAEMDADGAEAAEDEPGLVIDETSEFVANLQRPTTTDPKPAPTIQKSVEIGDRADSEESDVDMKQTYNDVEDEEALLARLRRERSTATPDLTTTGLEAEATMDQGLGAAFNLLKQRGLVKTADMGDINALHRDRQRFLAEKQRRETEAEQKARVQRERDRNSGKLERMSAREREEHARWENKQRDQLESRQMADVFNREYKPDVQLKYVDEHGRSMNQKEAFKHLSHQFHGKGSGKQKTEKHLKKIEDEKKREAMSALDASQATGMNNAMGTTAKRNKQAGVRLG